MYKLGIKIPKQGIMCRFVLKLNNSSKNVWDLFDLVTKVV